MGIPIVGLFMLLTAMNVGGQVILWENAHWTAAAIVATLVSASSVRRSSGLEQRVRLLIAAGVAFWLIGQLAWNLETLTGDLPFPGPADLPWLLTAAPAILALVLVVRGRISRAEESAVYLDAAAIFLAITALILQAFGISSPRRLPWSPPSPSRTRWSTSPLPAPA